MYDAKTIVKEIREREKAEQERQRAEQITATVNAWLDAHPNVKQNAQARTFISNYVLKACGGDFSNPKNFDAALAVRLNFENLAESLVKWFEAPSVPYFAKGSQKNWDAAIRWLRAQDVTILTIADWERVVTENLYTVPAVFDWDITIADLSEEIRKTNVGGRQDTQMLYFQDGEPAGGLLVQRFGIERIREAWAHMVKSFSKGSASNTRAGLHRI